MLKFAHRAQGFGHFENSLSAIRQAIKNDYHIEIDARLTKDNKWIVLHDAYLDRATTGTGLVSQKTLREIRKHTLIDGQPIPLLSEALALLKNNNAHAIIELKSPGSEESIITILDANDLFKRTIIATWNPKSCEALRKDSRVQTCLFYIPAPRLFTFLRYHKQLHFDGDHIHICMNKTHSFPAHLHGALINSTIPRVNSTHLGVPAGLITESYLSRVSRAQYGLIAMGVNSHGRAKDLESHNIHAMITDRPSSV